MPLCFVVVLFGFELIFRDVMDKPEHEEDEEDEHPFGEEANGRVVVEFGFHRFVVNRT